MRAPDPIADEIIDMAFLPNMRQRTAGPADNAQQPTRTGLSVHGKRSG